MTSSTDKFRPGTQISARIVDGQLIILRPGNDELLRFNEVASFVWSVIEQSPSTLEELAIAVSSEFEVDQETALKDISEFLHRMVEQSLIQV
jgi:hypothetical protein